MPEYREVTPIAGPEAFRSAGRDAELSQAAIVLSAGAAVAGRADAIDQPDALGLPAGLEQARRADRFLVREAAAGLDLDLRTHLEDRALRLPLSTSADLTRQLIDRPAASTAATLVEANLHSDSLLVRTSAAVAALNTTGPRDDVVDRLVEGARSRDALTREIGRVGLGRVAPQHPVLRRLVRHPGPPAAPAAVAALAPAAPAGAVSVLTHGTFAANTSWWKPGGTLFTYLDRLVPALHMHNPSFGWSSQYSDGARQLAAQQLVTWGAGFGLHTPDMFSHSHGGTVANLATRRGLQFDRMVMMSWPVHGEWFPDFTKVRIVVDIRVNFDLVILADLGGQTYVPPAAFRTKVVSHINGWFNHSDTNDPAYWEHYGLPPAIKV
jgi:hypothetical protein